MSLRPRRQRSQDSGRVSQLRWRTPIGRPAVDMGWKTAPRSCRRRAPAWPRHDLRMCGQSGGSTATPKQQSTVPSVSSQDAAGRPSKSAANSRIRVCCGIASHWRPDHSGRPTATQKLRQNFFLNRRESDKTPIGGAIDLIAGHPAVEQIGPPAPARSRGAVPRSGCGLPTPARSRRG